MRKHTKPKRHKAYRPRPTAVDNLLLIAQRHAAARENAQPIPADDAVDLHLAYRIAFQQLVAGDATEHAEAHWCTVVCALNISLVLAERGAGAEYEPQIIAALDGAFRARLRAQQTKAWRFDGDAIQAIRAALEVHDAQVEAVSKDEMRAALEEVHRRVDAGHVYREAA